MRRWQSYATPRFPAALHRRWNDTRQRETERQADAAYRLHLRELAEVWRSTCPDGSDGPGHGKCA